MTMAADLQPPSICDFLWTMLTTDPPVNFIVAPGTELHTLVGRCQWYLDGDAKENVQRWQGGNTAVGNLSWSVDSFLWWWFQLFLMFTPTWGNDPIWLIFFKQVETTKLMKFSWNLSWSIHPFFVHGIFLKIRNVLSRWAELPLVYWFHQYTARFRKMTMICFNWVPSTTNN